MTCRAKHFEGGQTGLAPSHQAVPGKVIRQVLCGHASQTELYPGLELLVIVIGGLDLEGLVGVDEVAGHEVAGFRPR